MITRVLATGYDHNLTPPEEHAFPCAGCGVQMDESGDVFSIYGDDQPYCETCHDRDCILCNYALNHEDFPPHTNIDPQDCEHKTSVVIDETTALCTYGCGGFIPTE